MQEDISEFLPDKFKFMGAKILKREGRHVANPRGDLVVQGDVPVAKFRVLKSAIYYLLGSKNFQIYYRLGL